MWSAASRRRLLRVSGAIDWEGLRDTWGGDWLLATLTYRDDPGPSRAKRDLDVLGRRWARRWGACRWVWKMEFQRRGVVHFHVLAWVPDTGTAPLTAYRHWLWRSWAEIAGAGQRLRVDADYIRAHDMVRYFVAYAVEARKAYQHVVPESWRSGCGRWWGVRGLPVLWRESVLSGADYIRARRILMRYRRSRSRRKVGRSRGLSGCWVLGQSTHSLRDALYRCLANAPPCSPTLVAASA
jgi:hypothetical protein